MAATNVNVSGTVKFFDQSKGFGIIKLAGKPSDVFIHVSKCGGRQAELVQGAEVKIDFVTAYKDGQYKHSATALLSVKAPPAPIEVLDTVKFYDPKRNFGFIFCADAGLSKGEAILRGHVAKAAGIIPGEGMPVRALVVQKAEGPEVLSFEWGPDVEAAYAAKLGELHAEDGAVGEDEQSEPTDNVDALMAEHARETKRAIGQLPADADDAVEAEAETVAEAPVKPKQRRAPKKSSVGSLAELGTLVPGSQPNGSAVEARA